MKVIVISQSSSTGNIVRGALQQHKIPDLDFVSLPDGNDLAGHVAGENTVIMIDWNGEKADVCAEYVKKASEAAGENSVPILLLTTKQEASTTFAGMKAGAKGLITKPIQPEELVKALAKVLKSGKSGNRPTINVEFINPFIEATKTVFATMVGMEVERKRLFLKNDHHMFGDISGVMGLSGAASGSVVVSLPKDLALDIFGKMIGGDTPAEISPEVSDAIGEIINMISGQAKASLAKTKYHFQISIPTVVKGSGHEVTHKQGTPNIVVIFAAGEAKEFALQVCLRPGEDENGGS